MEVQIGLIVLKTTPVVKAMEIVTMILSVPERLCAEQTTVKISMLMLKVLLIVA